MLLVQLTDLHVRPPGRLANGVVDTNRLAAEAIDSVLAMRPTPDAVLVSGDLTDRGTEEEYRVVRDLLDRLPMSVHVVPGNHDNRAPMRAAFADRPEFATDPFFLHYAVDLGDLRLIALDTVVAGQSHGELCPTRLAWLERALAEAPERPTLVMMHHPPFLCGIGHMDRINCRDGDALGAIVERHPQIERIVCGHHHRPIQVRWRGTVVNVAPSVAHQVELGLEPQSPAAFRLEPPGFLVHVWLPGTGLVTHQSAVGRWPGPYPFTSAG
ncbi:MAG: phosphodiesterase [Geminicoccaceae bacterium]